MTREELDGLKPGDMVGSGMPGIDLYLQLIRVNVSSTDDVRYEFIVLLDASDSPHSLRTGKTFSVGETLLIAANVVILRD